MRLRGLLGKSLVLVGLLTVTQVNAQGLGCRWGGSGYYPGAWGSSGLAYDYRYNFGCRGGNCAYVGLGYVGSPDAAYGYVQSGPLVPATVRGGYSGYGRGRCGYGLSPTGNFGTSKMPGSTPGPYGVPGTTPGTTPGLTPALTPSLTPALTPGLTPPKGTPEN